MGRFRLEIGEKVQITDIVAEKVIELPRTRFEGEIDLLYIERNWSKATAVVAGADTVQRYSVAVLFASKEGDIVDMVKGKRELRAWPSDELDQPDKKAICGESKPAVVDDAFKTGGDKQKKLALSTKSVPDGASVAIGAIEPAAPAGAAIDEVGAVPPSPNTGAILGKTLSVSRGSAAMDRLAWEQVQGALLASLCQCVAKTCSGLLA
eukprot:6468332-Amphidinium_carterae.4